MPEQPARVELETPDLAAENRQLLEDTFPGLLVDGVVDASRLSELLDVDVVGIKEGHERYGLMWAGKAEAVRSLLTPSRGALVPELEKSIDFDAAENVFIEGDNLEVLKLMQKAYNDRMKLIYIDPPYNTGRDFVYTDNYRDGLRAYLEFTGQIGEDGDRATANMESSGRFHSAWLSMMYPRLVLARNLLRQDGFIFISISDTEVHNLRAMCDSIFGEENRVETFIWQSIFRPSNMSRRVRRNAEYVLCYARDASRDFELVERLQEPQGEASLTQNNNAYRDLEFAAGTLNVLLDEGIYASGPYEAVELRDDLRVAGGKNQDPVRIRGRFKWSQEYLESEIEKGVYLCIKTESFIPYYRKDYKKTALRPTKLLPRDIVGDVLQANAEVARLVGEGVFDYPKPTSLIRLLMAMTGVSADDVVLDFFAGSGTTAHAVLLENEADGGKRRCISVNLPEPTPPESKAREAGFPTVSSIARTRIRTASEQHGSGLRVLRLDGSRFRTTSGASSQETQAAQLELDAVTLVDEQVDVDAIACEVLLAEGVPLEEPWARLELGGASAIESGHVIVVASIDLNADVVEACVAQRPPVLVFLEDGFGGRDALKADAFFTCGQLGITMKTV